MATIVGTRRDPEVHRLLEIVLDEQKSNWTSGERTSVEVFLSRYPRLRDDAEAVLDLSYQEQVLRQERGETIALEEFLSRFPDRAESLMLQFAADQAMPSSEFPTEAQTCLTALWRDHPKTFGAYEVAGVLGRGGMGVVYKAYDKNLKRFVAVKTIAGGRDADPTRHQRFEIEAHAVARLQHSNILQIHEINEHEGCPYIVLEYAQGGSLADKINDKPQPHHEVAAIVETLARAIHIAHGQGIIHRDLKPSNILLTAENVYKISDFGLAKLVDDESLRTQSGDLVGTPSFMAPEQAQGHSHSQPIGPTADIYSLGAILYQALTGRPPFLGGSAVETLKQVIGTEVVPPRRLRPGVPRDLETICLKCLEKSPGNRYATALELAEDLRRFQCGATILARRSGILHRSWKWTKRHPWQTTSALLLLASSLTLAGFCYWHNRLLRAEIGRTQAKTDEAHRNYREARSTIQTMLNLLDNPRIEGVPRLMELRNDQRQAALTFYEQILRDVDSADSVVLVDMIHALAAASMLQHHFGHNDRAKEEMGRALNLIEKLRTKQPDAIEFLKLEIDTLMKLGNYTIWLGPSDRSMDWLRKSMELAERLVMLAPDDPSNQDMPAVFYI
jgi:eukaryotic-like serine/threonine-protein kinase